MIKVKPLLLVVALLLSYKSFAQTNSPVSGGDGGTPFTISCDAGRVLIGVKGKAGSYVDRIEGICARLNEIIMPASINSTDNFAGGSGGSDFEQLCPSG